jgi:hypothetical protein
VLHHHYTSWTSFSFDTHLPLLLQLLPRLILSRNLLRGLLGASIYSTNMRRELMVMKSIHICDERESSLKYIFVTLLSIPDPFKSFFLLYTFSFSYSPLRCHPTAHGLPPPRAPISYPAIPLSNIHSFTASNSALCQNLTKQTPQKRHEPLCKSKLRHNPNHKNLYELPCSNSELFYTRLLTKSLFLVLSLQTSGLRPFGLLFTLTRLPESSVMLEQKLQYFKL